MAYLIVREPGRVAYTVPLGAALVAGRDAGCDLVLGDGRVSRRHLRVEAAAIGYRAVDLDSTHGTLLNGEGAHDAALADGDVVQIGAVVLVFRDGSLDDASAIQQTISRVVEPPRRATAEDARRLRLLFELGRVISALDDVDGMLGHLLDAALDALGCERGLVGLVEHGRPARRVERGDTGDLVIGAAALAAIVGRRESVLVRDGASRAIGAPMDAGDRVIGFLYLDDRGRASSFANEDLEFVTVLAQLSAAALDHALRQRRLRAVADALEDRGRRPIIGDSPAIQRLRREIEACARSRDAAVLIRGETGTGKELVAAHIHSSSPRADQPFVAVNCAAIPETLIESELFGHVKGAFSGAAQSRRGRFAAADGGTIFLDEIADLSPAAQAKLLRVLEDGEVQPIGSDLPSTVDARVLSATHKDLESEVAAGRFRQDLYYRLDVVTVEVPPVRERGDDVLLLASHFLAELAPRIGRAPSRLSEAAAAALRAYAWPGNVRQVRNEIERALLFAEGTTIEPGDLRIRGAAALAGSPAEPDLTAIETAERRVLADALERSGGNIQAAAQALGISRGTLYRKIERYGLRLPK